MSVKFAINWKVFKYAKTNMKTENLHKYIYLLDYFMFKINSCNKQHVYKFHILINIVYKKLHVNMKGAVVWELS